MDCSGDALSAATKLPSTTSTQVKSGATLRRPVQVVKKRSGPLDEALAELNKTTASSTTLPTATTSTTTTTSWPQVKTQPVATRPSSSPTVTSPFSSRRRYSTKDKEKKRERWLLTRKTWKYMTDAGRKLIPDGAQNRKEDIPKIEAHFQQTCASEPSFILWRRKSSYPGAMRNSKKRLKQLLQHTGQRSQHVIEQEEVINADQVLELLHSHLKLDEAIKTDTLLGTKTVRPDQTSSPSAQRPKPSGSAIRRACGYGVEGSMPVSLRGPGFLPPAHAHLQQLGMVDQLLERLRLLSRSQTLHDTINVPPEKINADLLNDRTTLKKIYTALKKQQLHRILSKHSMPPKPRTNLSHSSSMLSLLHFGGSSSSNIKAARQHEKTTKPSATTTSAPVKTTIPATKTSSSSAVAISGSYHTHPHTNTNISTATTMTTTTNQRQRKPPSSLNLLGFSTTASNEKKTAQLRRHHVAEKQTNSCGTQTNFIQLNEIKRLAEEYKEYQREEAAAKAAAGGGATTTDDEAEKQGSGGGTGGGTYHHRRKSSIDNEDVSQSVSDTIKRYLRMARKKSVHDDNANRFKRVNYDRNLRNIRAKGEINPPGMDEDNDKAVQTLDAWALITLDFIRGNENSGVLEMAHKEWQEALAERIRKKLEYEEKILAQKDGTATDHTNQQHQRPPSAYQSVSSCSSSSAPTSPTSPLSPTITNRTSTTSSCSTYDIRPTLGPGGGGNENLSNVPGGGIFHSSSQFIANLWHGATSSSNSSSPTSVPSATSTTINTNAAAYCSPPAMTDVNIAPNNSSDMQKSKSSSHVGHFVSRKILRSRSKSQTRPPELSTSLSTSPSALSKWTRLDQFIWTSDNGDRILLLDTTFYKLSDLETKMLQKVSMEKISELNIGINLTGYTEGKSQKRRILAKKKAMTTSFFDIGKKDYSNSSLSLFGNSLESCVVNDKKRETSNLSASNERGSRNSISSLFRVGGGGSGVAGVGNIGSMDSHKLSENVRSCESLPSGSCDNANKSSKNTTKTPLVGNYFGNLAKSASMQLSRSQTDVRRRSQEIGGSSELSSPIRDSGECLEIDMYKELQVPKFVMSCINYLEENGLHKVGLFRVSTSKKRVKQLREDFDKNAEKKIDPDTCPHNVATLLKEFLRDLPEPLLSNGLYKAFLETQKIRNRRLQLEAISHLVKLLPPAHRDTLYVLLRFLAKVAASSDDATNGDGSEQLTGNKMDSNNLATVFAPNILRSTANSQSSSTSAGDRLQSTSEQESISDAINVIRIMIDHYEELFRVSAELLDVVYTQLLDESPEELYTICEYHSNLLREQQGIPPALSIPDARSTSISSSVPLAAKRLYKRETVMHNNDASRAPDNVSSHSSSSIISKRGALKNRHPDASKTSSSSLTDRRQSSPNVLDQAGIVSASLQIPMHINYGSSDEIVVHTSPTNINTYVPDRNVEYSNIPYMEDFREQSPQNPPEFFQISGSLMLSTKNEVTPTEAAEESKNRQQQHNGKLSNFAGHLTGSVQNTVGTTSKDNKSSRNPLSNEPKLPASITNIGGAILRSKTADFERMSNRKNSSSSSPQKTTSTVTPQTVTATTANSSHNTAKTSGHQHLYKRQELIPSAKRSQHK